MYNDSMRQTDAALRHTDVMPFEHEIFNGSALDDSARPSKAGKQSPNIRTTRKFHKSVAANVPVNTGSILNASDSLSNQHMSLLIPLAYEDNEDGSIPVGESPGLVKKPSRCSEDLLSVNYHSSQEDLGE